jgi:hypothetical protein
MPPDYMYRSCTNPAAATYSYCTLSHPFHTFCFAQAASVDAPSNPSTHPSWTSVQALARRLQHPSLCRPCRCCRGRCYFYRRCSTVQLSVPRSSLLSVPVPLVDSIIPSFLCTGAKGDLVAVFAPAPALARLPLLDSSIFVSNVDVDVDVLSLVLETACPIELSD